MRKRIGMTFLALSVLCSALPVSAAAAGPVAISEEYLFAGRNSDYYTEESYRSSPVVVDLEGDGTLEVLNAAHNLVVMDAATGAVKWRINSGKDRRSGFSDQGNTARQVFTDFEVLDLDADGKNEIVIGYGDGSVSVLDHQGYFKPGWPQKPSSASIRSIATADLDGDGKQEIVVGSGIASAVSVWVYRCDGTLMPGWPQLSDRQNGSQNRSVKGTAYSYGVFGDGIAIGDLDGDGQPDIIVPTDTAYIVAYHTDGSLVTASDIYGGRSWGKVALYEDYDQEQACVNEGWGYAVTGRESREELYRAELGHSAAVYTDVDGDGTFEVVVTALMADRTSHTKTNQLTLADTRYMTVFILNGDRSRYENKALGFDWSRAPRDLGQALKKVDRESVAAKVFSEPVCVDLNGDGLQEILFNSYNGKLHCFSLDGTEHGSWPFTLPKTTADVYEYATPPACVDLDGDGRPEVIFASWTDNEAESNIGVNGSLYVLSGEGELLASQSLHDGYSTYEGRTPHQNGVMAAPVVRDVDADGKYEVLLNTTYYGLCAYELDGGKTFPVDGSLRGNPVAYARTQTVQINSWDAQFQAYALKDEKGNETNYVKLRDLALAMNATGDKFQVGWNGSVSITTGQAYVPNGTEMKTPYTGERVYSVSTAPTLINGQAAELDSILLVDDNGNGYTYYKLRDLGSALGFTVDWSPDRGIYIEAK